MECMKSSTGPVSIFVRSACLLLIGMCTNVCAQVGEPEVVPDEHIAGNTLTVGNKLGTLIVNMLADNTYRTLAPNSNSTGTKGRWKLNDEGLCLTQTEPLPPAGKTAPTNCLAITDRKVGDTWEIPDSQRGVITYGLIEGLIDYRDLVAP